MAAITFNGRKLSIPESTSIAQFIAAYSNPAAPKMVKRNDVLIAPAAYATVLLKAGDTLQIVLFLGGG